MLNPCLCLKRIGLLWRYCLINKTDENQYSSLSIHRIRSTPYGLPLSSCFPGFEEEDDPVLEHIRYVDYRYIRFVFHPLKGKFLLMSHWRDSWRNVNDVKDGLEGETQEARARLFGENVIDIEEKPLMALLLDEVQHLRNMLTRSSIRFTSFKFFQSYCGRWISITIMRRVSF